jgi:hypothetical protein
VVENPGDGWSGETGLALNSNPCSTKGSWQRTQYCENIKDAELEKYFTSKEKMKIEQNANAG